MEQHADHSSEQRSKRSQRTVLASLVMLLAFMGAERVDAQCQYDVTLIVPPACPGGGVPYIPRNKGEDMSETGVVVGWYEWCDFSLRKHPFMWSEATGFQQLERPPGYGSIEATGISSDGRYIVGYGSKLAESQVWTILWDNGVPTEIPPFGEYTVLRANDVNNAGVITGYIHNAVTSPPVAFRYANGTIELLQTPDDSTSTAYQINEASMVAGSMGVFSLDVSATLWSMQGPTNLPTGIKGARSRALTINNRGHSAGVIVLPDSMGGLSHAACWQGTQPSLLPMLSECEFGMAVTDIADTGQMIGTCDSDPLIWQGFTAHFLDDLVSDSAASDVLTEVAIDNTGQILALVSADIPDVQELGIVAVLRPSSSDSTDLNHDCVTNVFDLLLLLQEWDRDDSFADIDNSGTVDVSDLLELMAGWG